MNEEMLDWDDESCDIDDVLDDDSEDTDYSETDVLNRSYETDDLIGQSMDQGTSIIGDDGSDTDVVNTNVGKDTTVVASQLDQTSFVGSGWDCTCYGSCGCKYYRPKSENDDDCFYCGHHKSDHTPR